ncbi:hypothetical protein Tco_1481132, partial [Tanacetum coccineum]
VWKFISDHEGQMQSLSIDLDEDNVRTGDITQYFSNKHSRSIEVILGDMQAMATEKRRELIKAVLDVDGQLAKAFISDEPLSSAHLEVIIIEVVF